MSKIDKNDMIYFKECCDKTYATSKNIDSNSLVQQTVDGNNVFPKTKAKAIIMSDGKTLEEAIQSGDSSIVRVKDVVVIGTTSFTSTGSQQINISLSPSNYNIEVETIEVVSDCSEITFSNITNTGFKMNINSVPSAINHKLTIKVKDKLGTTAKKEVPFTVTIPATSINVSGSTELDASTGSATANYTVSYSPTYNVPIKSLQVTSSNTKLVVSNVTTSGFKLTTTATDDFTATLTLKATNDLGSVITKTLSINVTCGPDYDAIDEYGVAIMGVNNKFYKDAAEWQAAGSPTPNGIAVSDGTHRFCIAKDIVESVCATSGYAADAEYWGADYVSTSGAHSAGAEIFAIITFDGVASTDGIVKNVTSSDSYFNKAPWSAAGLCRQFTFPNGSKGYLGATGEWQMVQNSLSLINTLMAAISGANIETSTFPFYWSSIQCDMNYAWYWDFNNAKPSTSSKRSYRRVRAFCTF